MTSLADQPSATQPDVTQVSSGRAALASALRHATYEVLPFKSAEEKVLAHVPRDVGLTVTTTESKGLAPTIDLASALGLQGYTAAPHLAARQVRDRAHLVDVVAQLREANVTNVFVVGGDAENAGDFQDALSLLTALEEIGHPFTSVGVGGYPEGHGKIPDSVIEQATRDKARHATEIITQLCFDGRTTLDWAHRLRAGGVQLPIKVGIPGAISRQKLVRVSAGLGLGQSAKFLAKQQGMLWRFFLPGGYSPNKLVEKLTPAFGRDDNNLAGFHIFTFNDLDSTEAWRQRWLSRLR